jgi:UDP-glucuronate 4-epimerase
VTHVFHQAGQPGVRGSWGLQFDQYLLANVLATQRLLEAASRGGGDRFVNASSSSVYGLSSSFPTTEEQVPRPVSPYGVSKLAGEQLVNLYSYNHGLPTVALRYHTVFGPRQRPDMATHRLFESALSGTPFPVFSALDHIRDFTFVGDIVEANMKAAVAQVPSGATVNIAGGASITMRELLALIERISGRAITLEERTGQPGDVARTGGSIELAKRLLDWEPRTSIEEGLGRQWEWHRAR